MKTSSIFLAVMLVAVPSLRAQIVADGATNTLSNVTNTITGDVTVGNSSTMKFIIVNPPEAIASIASSSHE